MTTATPEGGTLQRLLDDGIEPFLEHLRAARYADETVHWKRAIAKEFAQWARQHLIVAGGKPAAAVASQLERPAVRLVSSDAWHGFAGHGQGLEVGFETS